MAETLDDFLTYTNRTKTTYSKWKEDGSTIIWLAKLIAPKRLWRHRLKRVVDVKDSTTNQEEQKIWSDNIVCLEPEDILKDQNLLVRLTGQRKRPPHTCPVCLFMEHIRSQILSRKLDWLAPVLRYETDEEEVVVTAQGMLGFPKTDKMNDDQKRQLKDAGIFLKDAWKEDARAKMNWIFVFAEHKHPEKGLQVGVESASLGDKVRSQIQKAMEKAGMVQGNSALGNPLINPYPFKWEYNEDAIAFGDKYDATALEGTPCPEEIAKLIDSDPPSIEGLLRHPDLVELRASLEKHCVLKGVPWDDIFRPAYDLYKENGWEVVESSEAATADSEVAVSTSNGFTLTGGVDGPAPVEIVGCDKCGADMLATDTVCSSCKFDYAPKAAPLPPPPAPVRKSRSAVTVVDSAPKPIAIQVDDQFPRGKSDDEIPF